MAVIKSSNATLLLLGADLAVIAASTSFCHAFELDAGSVDGRQLSKLGEGEWAIRTLSSLLRATASGHAEIDAYEMDLTRKAGPPGASSSTREGFSPVIQSTWRLVLAVSDVTDARSAVRLNDELLREKAVLLDELQHRVANSLQIIASVLLQSARRVQSDETRSHLHDAHQRVMSVATLQRQLTLSRLDEVGVREYLKQLCQSLGASMIRDPRLMSLEVNADDSVTGAHVSVSLGLIVTELVINAFKHAFPGDHGGRVVVGYRSTPVSWTLSVSDNGVGMPKDAGTVASGLGTSIVEALAKQLHARLEITDTAPGTSVSVIHVGTAVLGLVAA